VNADLTPFEHIVPCGLANRPVTSVYKHIEVSCIGGAGSGRPQPGGSLMKEYSKAVVEAFEEEFRLHVQHSERELDK
jgi:lipoate-protein ligase B